MSLVSVAILLGTKNAEEALGRLKQAGLDVTQFLPRFNQVYGVVDEGALDALRAVDGVEFVRPEETFTASDGE